MSEYIKCPRCKIEANPKNALVIMQPDKGYLYYCRNCRMVWEE